MWVMENDKKQMHFYFIYFRHHWKLSKHNVKGKLHRSDRVYPPGTDRSSWVAACPFCGLPSHLPDHSLRQCEHDFINQNWLKASDSNVLLPQPPLLCRSLLCHQRHSSDAGQSFIQEKNYFLPWLLYTVWLFHFLGAHRYLYAHSNGLWPLHGHLQTLVIWQQNVPRCLPLSRCYILYLWLCKRSCTDHPDAPPLLLWTQWNQPLLLCRPTSPSPGLLRHSCQWNCHVRGGWFQPRVFSHHHPHFLHFHLYSHSANAFSRREAQGLLHLWVSSDSCHYVLWHTVLDVSEAAFWGICRTDQNCSCFLYLSESYA